MWGGRGIEGEGMSERERERERDRERERLRERGWKVIQNLTVCIINVCI